MSTAHPFRFGPDWTSHHFADWSRWLAPFRNQPVRGLEVGSFEGRSAVWFFQHILTDPQSTLIAIDPWDYAEEKSIVPGVATHIADQFDWTLIRERFTHNIAPWQTRCHIMPFPSQVALPLVPRHPPIAFAYLDGSHTAAAVLSDACMIWPRLMRGSVLIFDDYNWHDSKPARGWPDELLRPKLGIDRFLEVFSRQYTSLEHSNDQVKLIKSV